MRLSAGAVKEAILHPDKEVREAAVNYFARSFSPDPTIMPLVIEAIEQYGWNDAFEAYAFLDDLVQTEDTLQWLIQQLGQANPPTSEREAQPILAASTALIHADPVLLERHRDQVMGLEILDDETRDAIDERIWFLSRPGAELWQDLKEFCHTHEADSSVPTDDFNFACRIVQALGRHRDQFADEVVAILQGTTGDFDNWMAGFAVRLAGEMKLEAAIPCMMEMLNDDNDWLNEECHLAFVKMGSDAIVSQFAQEFRKADWNLRMSVAYILEDIHSDLSVQTCLDLLKVEEEDEIKGQLLQAVLLNFATEGIELARQFILNTPLDPDVLEVRTALLTACKLMDARFPEFDAWQEDSKNDQEFRRRWYQEHPLAGDDSEERSEDDEFEEGPAPPPATIVRTEPRVGRNDPCPCGSGKKYKKCCYSKRRVEEESDIGHSAALSGVSYRQSVPQYPIGTIALYGPNDRITTKIVAGVVQREGAEAIVERWVGTNVKDNPKVKQQIQEYFKKHGVRSVVATDSNIGCPHEEGEDFPSGEDCPFCPFWKGKQGTARGQ